MVTHPGQILNPATPDQHHRVFLEVVANSWNIGGHFDAIG
jgi:hypothetical protein